MMKREQSKKLLMFSASTVLLVALTAIYAFFWYRYYTVSGSVGETFSDRGHYVVIGLYAVMYFMFGKVFGAFKAGSARILESLYTQLISILCANAVTYLQLCLIGNWHFLEHSKPILYMTGMDFLVATDRKSVV